MAKTTQAQMRAAMKYQKKHPEQTRMYRYRSYGKKFLKEMATLDDLKMYEEIIRQRREELTKGNK